MSSTTEPRTEKLTFRRYPGRRHEMEIVARPDLPGELHAQVPDLHTVDAAVPGQLPVRRGHPRLPQHRPRHREAARGHAVAGIRVSPPDRGEPLSVGDGPRLPGALRDRLQPQRGRGPRRHQLGRALPRRVRHREQARVRRAAGEDRQEGRRDRRRAGGPVVRVPAGAQGPRRDDLRRARNARRHDALRHSGIPHAARGAGRRDPADRRSGRGRAPEMPDRDRRHAGCSCARTTPRCSSAWARNRDGRCRRRAATRRTSSPPRRSSRRSTTAGCGTSASASSSSAAATRRSTSRPSRAGSATSGTRSPPTSPSSRSRATWRTTSPRCRRNRAPR